VIKGLKAFSGWVGVGLDPLLALTVIGWQALNSMERMINALDTIVTVK
jgi:hypothetical protein